MSLLPRWTTGISERVMDATALVMDAADEDGKRTAREEAALAALRDVQRAITETDHEITAVDRGMSDMLSVMRQGKLAESRKRRLRANARD